jgi:ketosteroid isomerase-like protein
MARRIVLHGLIVITALACRPAETPDQMEARMRAESDAARPAIEAQLARFSRGAAAGNIDSMMAVYAPNAVVMPPGMPAVIKSQDLRAMFAASGPFTIAFQIQNVSANGPMAVDRGTATYSMTPPGGGAAMTVSGKYLAHWRMIGGQWLMVEDIWNDDAPPPAPPPARR